MEHLVNSSDGLRDCLEDRGDLFYERRNLPEYLMQDGKLFFYWQNRG